MRAPDQLDQPGTTADDDDLLGGARPSLAALHQVTVAAADIAMPVDEDRDPAVPSGLPADLAVPTDRFLAAIVASSDDAIISKTLEGTITSWNPAAERLYGYSAPEAVGQPISLIIPADHPYELSSIMERLRRGERIDHFETVRVHKHGKRLDVSVSISPIRDGTGQIVGAASIARDITAPARLEREQRTTLEIINQVGRLLTAELDLEPLVQALTDAATTLTGAKFGAFFYNAIDERGEYYTIYAIAGVPREAFSNFPMPRNTALFGPTFRGEGATRIADVRQDARFGQNPPYFGMPEGHLPVVSYLAVPVIGRAGEVLGGLFFGHPEPGMFGERAERLVEGLAAQAAVAIENARLFQQAQRELAARRESEERLRAVWESTSEALALSDPDGIVLEVNPAYCALYGRSPEEVIGQRFDAIFAEATRDEAMAKYRAVFDDPDPPRSYEARVQRPDGSERVVEARADFLLRDGARVAMISVIRDVTERKRLDQAQQDFVAMASHDLASPLTVLRARAQLMLRRKTFDEESMVAMLDQTTRMDRLIGDLRQLAQIEGGGLSLQREPIDLAMLAQEAVTRACSLTTGHRVRLVAPEALVTVVGDRFRLAQVFDNLLNNAIKYSPQGGEIVVRVEADGREARMSVSDQGIGIAPEALPQLFERFYRGRHTGGEAGLGLGLYITRMLVEAHGGRIWAESEVDSGSIFTIALPRGDRPATPGD